MTRSSPLFFFLSAIHSSQVLPHICTSRSCRLNQSDLLSLHICPPDAVWLCGSIIAAVVRTTVYDSTGSRWRRINCTLRLSLKMSIAERGHWKGLISKKNVSKYVRAAKGHDRNPIELPGSSETSVSRWPGLAILIWRRWHSPREHMTYQPRLSYRLVLAGAGRLES